MFVPTAFNTYFGPIQWDIVNRCRPNDNQYFLAAISQAQNTQSTYESWGHTMIIDPFGKILTIVDDKEKALFTEIGRNT